MRENPNLTTGVKPFARLERIAELADELPLRPDMMLRKVNADLRTWTIDMLKGLIERGYEVMGNGKT